MSNNMSISSIKEHYNNLCSKAKEWSAAYYEQDTVKANLTSGDWSGTVSFACTISGN